MMGYRRATSRFAVSTATVIVLAALLASAGTSAHAQARPALAAGASDRAIVQQTIRDSIGWALTKDRPLLERIMAHDPALFIFNPDSKSTVVGWDAFVKNFDTWMDPRFKATSLDVRDLRVTFSRSGEVAWYSAILDDLGEWDGKPVGWKDTRWTGVLEKRDGAWVIVQMHFSFASDRPAASPAGQPSDSRSVDERLAAVAAVLRADAPAETLMAALRTLAGVAIELGTGSALPAEFVQHVTAAQALLQKEPLPELQIGQALGAAYRSVNGGQPFRVADDVQAKREPRLYVLEAIEQVRSQARSGACDNCSKRIVELMLLFLTPVERGGHQAT